MNEIELSELRQLADDGDPFAQNSLGARLAQAGGEENEASALYWYLQAVEQGFIDSMWNASTMLVRGEGGCKNRDLGMKLAIVAAKNGHCSACLYLACCFETGSDGFDQSAENADKWKERAWDTSLIQEFTEPIDVNRYLKMRPKKPGNCNSR